MKKIPFLTRKKPNSQSLGYLQNFASRFFINWIRSHLFFFFNFFFFCSAGYRIRTVAKLFLMFILLELSCSAFRIISCESVCSLIWTSNKTNINNWHRRHQRLWHFTMVVCIHNFRFVIAKLWIRQWHCVYRKIRKKRNEMKWNAEKSKCRCTNKHIIIMIWR